LRGDAHEGWVLNEGLARPGHELKMDKGCKERRRRRRRRRKKRKKEKKALFKEYNHEILSK